MAVEHPLEPAVDVGVPVRDAELGLPVVGADPDACAVGLEALGEGRLPGAGQAQNSVSIGIARCAVSGAPDKVDAGFFCRQPGIGAAAKATTAAIGSAPAQSVLRAGGGWWMIVVVECFASWRSR